MSDQLSFSSLAHQEKKKVTRREEFLREMEQCVPWTLLEELIEPFYPKAGNGRRPLPLRCMLRTYCLQQWFQLSDPAMEESLYDSDSMRRFAGIELGQDAIPDETTILNFRHLLEKHALTEQIFSTVQGYLEERGLLLRRGTITDATIITAPSSTKNKDRQRDPEMSSTKKGNQWHFGMKAHVGCDSESGLIHTVVCTTASVHDAQVCEELMHGDDAWGRCMGTMHGDEAEVYGDKAYADAARKQRYRERGIAWRVNIKAHRGRSLTEQEKCWNRSRSRVRSRVEHGFGVVKHLWGYRKIRYRGIYKNACQLFSLFALSNLYRVRHKIATLA